MSQDLAVFGLIVDANVLIKILQDEPDSEIAIDFLTYCNSHFIHFYAPTLFQYEVINVATKKKVALDDTLNLLNFYKSANLTLQEPSYDDWLLAEKICQNGNEKSGYPSMYDSIYHAMAINRHTTFVTADNRHIAKTKQLGSILLLNDWQTLFEN
ncbi:type II toxin-antitoxin system VapC family toxin [Faucicola mancuniensis]|uniref:type II toxin-antitoxin system VapC family toxin n=1 Tax=Faucicola mancuniensis TaxID=1309795 RepID=UPI0028F13619|nr:type II toxin-antitoxin system VapC family toxin [uncultured Moraxella sp.]